MHQLGTQDATPGAATTTTPSSPATEAGSPRLQPGTEAGAQRVGELVERAKKLLRDSGDRVPNAVHDREALASLLRELESAPADPLAP